MDILQRIKDIRQARNMSVYELAKKSGIDKNTIYRWYKLNYTPSFDSIKQICEKGFEISMVEFFATETDLVPATAEVKEIIELWTGLDENQKSAVKQIIKSYRK